MQCLCCFFVLLVWFSPGKLAAQHPQTFEVVLRSLGHQVLLQVGDSTTPVLPVVTHKNQHILQFAADWKLVPDSLHTIANRVFHQAQLSVPLNIAVMQCKTKEVVYAFNFHANDSLLAPCLGRQYPTDCYDIVITRLPTEPGYISPWQNERSEVQTTSSGANTAQWNWMVALGLAVLVVGLIWYFQRNKKTAAVPQQLRLGGYTFNPTTMLLRINAEATELTGKENALLWALYQAANQTLTKEQLLQEVWGDEGDYIGRTLDMYISKLRKKLAQDARIKIINIRGVGYKLVLPQ